jgi:serine/threonine protein kinase
MAPEVIREAGYGAAVDVWGLGIAAIEAAEGVPPRWDAHPVRVLFQISADPPPGPDGTPGLAIARMYTWFSVPALLDSLEAGVIGRDWLHLLPGHGRMGSFKTGEARDAALVALIARERANDAAGAPARAEWLGA